MAAVRDVRCRAARELAAHRRECALDTGRGGDSEGRTLPEPVLALRHAVEHTHADMAERAARGRDTNMPVSVQAELWPDGRFTNINLLVRGAHLALGIPALTPAAGVMGMTRGLGESRNCNLDNVDEDDGGLSRPNGWPSKPNYPDRWLHSDIKDVSYYYNFRFYQMIITKGDLQ